MEQLPQLLLLALFLLLPLLQFIGRWVRRKAEKQMPPRHEAEPPVPIRTRVIPLRKVPVATPPREGPREIPPPGRRVDTVRHSRPWLRLRDPADARRAIVLMTVLGPCRALEPERREDLTG